MTSILEFLVGFLIILLVFAVCKQALSHYREDNIEGQEFRVLNMADVMHKDTFDVH